MDTSNGPELRGDRTALPRQCTRADAVVQPKSTRLGSAGALLVRTASHEADGFPVNACGDHLYQEDGRMNSSGRALRLSIFVGD